MRDGLNQLRNRAPAWTGPLGFVIIVAAAVFWLAYDGGSYGLTNRESIALVVLWALVLALSLSVWPAAPVPRAALVAGGLLTAFAVWTGLSAFWAASPEKAFTEFDRVALYLGVFALAVTAAPRGSARRWLGGLAVSLTAVGLLALTSRLFPNLIAEPRELAQIFPAAERRLSYPVGYWNGLATLVAFALPALLFFAVHSRSFVLRALTLAPVPALAATVYLTSSRGGSLAAALAVFAYLALSSRRWTALGATVVGGAGSAGAIAVLVARPELVDHPHEAAGAIGQGHSAALLIGSICVATALVYGVLARVLPSPRGLGRTGSAVLVGIIVALFAAGIVAARPVHRFHEFEKVPPELGSASVQKHLFSGSGNGRWQLWEASVDEFQTRPVIGRGAGSYEAWWAQHGNLAFFVRDAHSLYLETLGELGIVGLVLLAAFFVSVLAIGARRLLGHEDEERSVVGALLAILLAFLFEAGVDWMWELTAVGVVMALASGLLVGPATEPLPVFDALDDLRPRALRLVRVGTMVILMGLVVAAAIPLLAAMEVRHSQDAANKGDFAAALKDARGAQSLQSWAATPYLQTALVYEQAGDLPSAIREIHSALQRDDSDWRIWLVAARLETKAGQIEEARKSLARARERNPRSALFASS